MIERERRARADRTRATLIRAAERLMAERGIEGASLNDIVTLAGQRNRSAILFHFGGRDELVTAIVLKHRPAINHARNEMLDTVQAGTPTVRQVVEALVWPTARCLRTVSGRDYLLILAERGARAGTPAFIAASRGLELDGIARANALLFGMLGKSPELRQRRIAEVELTAPLLLADIARDINRRAIRVRDSDQRVESVIELMTAGFLTLATNTSAS
jgi:AcrR family transcriptional regulator